MRVGIIPALAGNTGTRAESADRRGDHPRSRGEYVFNVTASEFSMGSSPLSRGIPRSQGRHAAGGGIIPALAGNTSGGISGYYIGEDHPRSRGEYGASEGFDTIEDGSSPLSRGILIQPVGPCRRVGIIPALAGNTPHRRRSQGCQRDHPRSRGEYPLGARRMHYRVGSSPLSRGIRPGQPRRLRRFGIIPALAGNTTWKTASE